MQIKKLRTLFAALPLVLLQQSAFAVPTIISSNTTWSTAATYSDEVIVQSGATLTVSANVTLTKSLTVNPGGHLVTGNVTMNMGDAIVLQTDYTHPNTTTGGATLDATNTKFYEITANGHWLGIQVWGMGSGKQQSHVGFARATMAACSVRKAHVGIANYKDPFYENGSESTTSVAGGGIILASTVTFLNNALGVYMKDYSYAPSGKLYGDRSSFSKCNFRSDNTSPGYLFGYSSSIIGKGFVGLVRVEGIDFLGCTFTRTTSGDIYRGIITYTGGFNVKDYCSGGSPYIASSPYTTCTGTATHCSFNNLNTAISVTMNRTRKTNIFDANFIGNSLAIIMTGTDLANIMRNSITNSSTSPSSGIAMNECTGFKIEQNGLSLSNFPGSSFANNLPDFAVGISIADAGNSYNDVYKNTVSNYDYALQSVRNNRADIATKVYTGLTFLCNTVNNTRDVSFDIVAGKSSKPFSGSTLTANMGMHPYQKIPNPSAGISATNYTAGNLFDTKSLAAGSPNQLFNNGTNSFKYYYSTGNARENPTYYNPTKVLASTSTCPARGSVSPVVTKYSDWTTYASNTSTDINTIMAITSPTENDLTTLSDLLANYQMATNQILTVFQMRDTTIIDVDSMIMVLENTQYIYQYKLMLADLYISQYRYSDAVDVVDDVLVNYQLNSAESTRLANLKKMFQIGEILHTKGTYDSLDTTARLVVSNIFSNDDGPAKYEAWVIRASAGLETVEPVVLTLDTTGGAHRGEATNVEMANNYNRLVLYPNPANESFTLEVDEMGLSAVVTDLTGKKIYSTQLTAGANTVNTSAFAPGIYLVKLFRGNTMLTVQKLVKQ
jgi:hypothetical protein